jgi:hypothetical protein
MREVCAGSRRGGTKTLRGGKIEPLACKAVGAEMETIILERGLSIAPSARVRGRGSVNPKQLLDSGSRPDDRGRRPRRASPAGLAQLLINTGRRPSSPAGPKRSERRTAP